jgi:hypothetical protein
MELRQRVTVAALWLGVAALMAITLYPLPPMSASLVLRLFVIAVAAFLAFVYLFDPRGVLSRQPFH